MVMYEKPSLVALQMKGYHKLVARPVVALQMKGYPVVGMMVKQYKEFKKMYKTPPVLDVKTTSTSSPSTLTLSSLLVTPSNVMPPLVQPPPNVPPPVP